MIEVAIFSILANVDQALGWCQQPENVKTAVIARSLYRRFWKKCPRVTPEDRSSGVKEMMTL
jgi:hypothetical protein